MNDKTTIRYWFRYAPVARDILSTMSLRFEWIPYKGDNPKYTHFAGRVVVVSENRENNPEAASTSYQLSKFADITERLDGDEWVELLNRGGSS